MKNQRKLRATLALLNLLLAIAAAADDDKPRHHHREELHNYIIERQTNYQVPSGSVPTSRMIIGSREIDIYPNGQMFEGNHMVGDRR